MAINRTPVLKRCRQLGLDPICSRLHQQEGKSIRQPKRRRKESEYGMQLREKQKAKFIYGVLEKQFHGYFKRAKSMPGITGDNLMQYPRVPPRQRSIPPRLRQDPQGSSSDRYPRSHSW